MLMKSKLISWISWVPLLLFAILILAVVGFIGVGIYLERYELGPGDETQEAFAQALRTFEAQENIDLQWQDEYFFAKWGWLPGTISESWDYKSSPQLSKYNIAYKVLLNATYEPDTGSLSLHLIWDEASTTKDVLRFIDSLDEIITEFESKPQVVEFADNFAMEDMGIGGTIYDGALWIETSRIYNTVVYSGNIWYDISTQSITGYSLPNTDSLTWNEFPDYQKIRAIVEDEHLNNKLQDCTVATRKKPSTTTQITFRIDDTILAYIRLVCGEAEEEKTLKLIINPDGTYQNDGIK